MTKTEIFRKLYEHHLERDKYLDRVPPDISGVLFDNMYTEMLHIDVSMLIDAVFGDHAEAVNWFIYEWKPGSAVGANGETFNIPDFDHYIEWMKKHEHWQD